MCNLDIHQVSIRYPSGIHPVSIRYPSDIHQVSIRYPSGIHQISIRYPSGIHQVSIRYPSGIHQVSIRYPSCNSSISYPSYYPAITVDAVSLHLRSHQMKYQLHCTKCIRVSIQTLPFVRKIICIRITAVTSQFNIHSIETEEIKSQPQSQLFLAI